MMKKLIALSLVLAVAGLANAGFVVTYKDGAAGVKAGDSFNVAWYNTEGDLGQLSIRIVTDAAVMAGGATGSGSIVTPIYLHPTIIAGVGEQLLSRGAVTDGSGKLVYYTAGDAIGGTTPAGDRIAAGTKVFSFDVMTKVGVLDGTYEINFSNINPVTQVATGFWKNYGMGGSTSVNTALGAMTYTVVPEPITMGLLSLGALFIRKRK